MTYDTRNKYAKDYYQLNNNILNKNAKDLYQLNKDSYNKYAKDYYKSNKDKINNYQNNQRVINFIFKLIKNNRKRINDALKSNSKTNNTIELLGCSSNFLDQWIMWKLFCKMNDSEFKEIYHIKHYRFIATFEFSIQENQFIAFNWQNTQPFFKSKNLSKGAKRNL